MGQLDSVSFGNKAEKFPISIEAPRATLLHHFNARFGVSEENLLAKLTGRSPIGKSYDIRYVPLYTDNCD